MRAVILAGGSGSRLWPLSTKKLPKQFLALFGLKSMLQTTFERLSNLPLDSLVTVCNEEHMHIVAEQLGEVDIPGSIILEPVERNTAPAIALAALYKVEEDPLLLVLPADHVISDQSAFLFAVQEAIPLAEQGKLVTFGVSPYEPHTGYGYIEVGSQIGGGFFVTAFREKPNLGTARAYLRGRNHYWNSGIFLFRASRYLAELESYQPEIYMACSNAMRDAWSDSEFTRIEYDIFEQCQNISIDYAVMESTDQAVVIPLDAGWDDVGSWSSIWNLSNKDFAGNATVGDVIMVESYNNYISAGKQRVAALGIEDSIVIEANGIILVARKDKAQDIEALTKLLASKPAMDSREMSEIADISVENETSNYGGQHELKHRIIEPGEKIHASVLNSSGEHWVIVAGQAKIVHRQGTLSVSKNQSVHLLCGLNYEIENLNEFPLEMVGICLIDL